MKADVNYLRAKIKEIGIDMKQCQHFMKPKEVDEVTKSHGKILEKEQAMEEMRKW